MGEFQKQLRLMLDYRWSQYSAAPKNRKFSWIGVVPEHFKRSKQRPDQLYWDLNWIQTTPINIFSPEGEQFWILGNMLESHLARNITKIQYRKALSLVTAPEKLRRIEDWWSILANLIYVWKRHPRSLAARATSLWISLCFPPNFTLSISCPSSNSLTRSPTLHHNLISRLCS